MALPSSNQAFRIESPRSTRSLDEAFTSVVKGKKIELIHEVGPSFHSPDIQEVHWIGPSAGYTKLTVRSRVASSSARAFYSPAYVATVRRRDAKKLRVMILDLAKHDSREDFAICTHPIVDGIKILLARLLDVELEGNTREILRRLRDTFLDGGWNRYREQAARDAASQVLQFLADVEAVEPRDASRFFDLLYRQGLRPVGFPLLELDEENLENDGCEETEAAH